MWRRPRCHGRTLRRCRRPMEFRPRRRHVRGSSRRWRSEMWGRTRWRWGNMRRRMWRHSRSLRHRRRMECRRGGTGHGRWCCRPSCRPRWSTPSMSLAGSLGGRADARRQDRGTNQKRRKANATRKHDCSSQLVTAHNCQRAGGEIVRCWPRPALRSSDAGSLRRNPASGSWRTARAPSRPDRW